MEEAGTHTQRTRVRRRVRRAALALSAALLALGGAAIAEDATFNPAELTIWSDAPAPPFGPYPLFHPIDLDDSVQVTVPVDGVYRLFGTASFQRATSGAIPTFDSFTLSLGGTVVDTGAPGRVDGNVSPPLSSLPN